MNKSALNIVNNTNSLLWNNQSDRLNPSIIYKNVPRKGNSTKTTVTSLRPGGISAPGKGVDIKHNSYHRYLEKLKGKTLIKNNQNIKQPKFGNKTQSYNLIFNSKCPCII